MGNGVGFFARIGKTKEQIDKETAANHAAYKLALENFDAYIIKQAELKGVTELTAVKGGRFIQPLKDVFIEDTSSVGAASTPLLADDNSQPLLTVLTTSSDKTVQELMDMRNAVVLCVNDNNNPRVKEVMTRALKATQAYADPQLRQRDPNVAKEYARSHWAVTRLGDAAKGVSFSMAILGCAGYIVGGVLIASGFGTLFGLAIMLGSTMVFVVPALSVAAFAGRKGTESCDRARVSREMSSVKKSSPGVR